MFEPSAKVIADSVNPSGDRLTTFVLTYHRLVHSEFLTHRMLSKNSSSSRALSISVLIDRVIEDEVFPLHWGKNQKGMSAKEEIENIPRAMEIWEEARNSAIYHATQLQELGLHKQVVNRLLEPFSSITVICTGTEYQNFFNQRCHPDAQPEIQALANKMKAAYDASVPHEIPAGRWHIPFVNFEDVDYAKTLHTDPESIYQLLIKIAVGRCARVSYLNHDGKSDIMADIKLHDRLLNSKPPHFSPFEHVAIALPNSEKRANFTGFESYRYQLEHGKG